ncbi:Uncharacterized protein TCM_030724 [Theobroma cacao]|uniref:ARM repeat superfamily protein n=1 Tax=Theobroma cacao TaxID=3641 RepID=A0A061F626_THECC|nr:Uncharacterized protein TCM_030724 [Theobroma cacao]
MVIDLVNLNFISKFFKKKLLNMDCKELSLVELGVIPVIVYLIRVGGSDTKLVAGNRFVVISTQIDYLGHVAQARAIPLLVELLQGPDPLGWDVAENALRLLAHNEENVV